MTFFQAFDNTGYVKINFISDDSIAIKMNQVSRRENSPDTSSPAFAGGYTYPILDVLALKDGVSRIYQILKAPLPKEHSVQHRNQIVRILDQPETVYSYVDGGTITIVQIEGYDRRATPLSSHGWSIISGPKTFKRLKTLNRPFRLHAQLDRPLRIHLVDDDAYTNEDMSEFAEKDVERLLDGGFVISREIFNMCLDNVEFPKLTDSDKMTPELMFNYYRSEEYLRQAQYFHAFNARIVGPMDFGSLDHEDKLWREPGMLKGEAFLNVSDTCERMNVDVICTRSAIKFELSNTQNVFVLMEPQKAKKTGVSSDLQTMVSLPAVFQFEDVANWAREYLETWFTKLKNDEIMQDWFSLAAYKFQKDDKLYQYNENDVLTLTKWNARAWLMSGRKITESPWLFEQLGSAIAKKIRSQDLKSLRFPVPCAAYAQVVSQSFASMAGCDIDVDYNEARWCDELEVLVVNDNDWLEMYESHGGHDLDDFFKIAWRRIDGQLKIIVVRSPNDWGEYTIFDYVDGDWYPEGTSVDGVQYSFPEVPSDPELWAERLSEALAHEGIIYTGLPSVNNPVPKPTPHPYSIADVLAQIDNNRASTTCVGANVNARMLWSLSTRRHRPQQLCPMETCIDTGTQGGSFEDAEAVQAEADGIVKTIIADPSFKVDQFIWMTRFAEIYRGIPFHRDRLTDQTDISKIHRFRGDVAQSFMRKVRDYAGTQLSQNVDVMIHTLGARFLREGYQTIRMFRRATVQANSPQEQDLSFGDWDDLHKIILDKIESFEKLSDRHDFLLGMYSACIKAPTSTGKINDQPVMNPHIFPYLLEALRFYGLAGRVVLTEDGQLICKYDNENGWDLKCVKCGESFNITKPKTLQVFHFEGEICKACR